MAIMNEASRLSSAAEQGDPRAAEELLPLVYDALRDLASRRLEREAPGQTLQATALVHEAYLRLIGGDPGRRWEGRGHFFAAAAEAMRRILVDRARDRRRLKRGGGHARIDLDLAAVSVDDPGDDLIDLDEALTELGREDPLCARLVALRFFAGLTQAEAAEALGMARRSADRHWAYARAWLYDRLRRGGPPRAE
jgi:RNA polymerase sigma factor (TIGR02999 family)